MAENRAKSEQYLLRLPPGLRESLKEAAELHARSLNAEIVERLEQYPRLFGLTPQVKYLQYQNGELEKELAAAKAALAEQKVLVKQLRHLMSEDFQKAEFEHANEQEAFSAIENRFNELKAQSDYLEALKVELLEISKERDEIKSEAESRVEEQARLIERLQRSQESSAVILKGFRKVFLKAADGDDDELKKLVEAFQVIGEEDD